MPEPNSILRSIAIALLVVAVAVLLRVASNAPAKPRRHGFLMAYPRAAQVVGGIFSVGACLGILGLFTLPENRTSESLPYVALAVALVVTPASWFFCETARKRFLVNS